MELNEYMSGSPIPTIEDCSMSSGLTRFYGLYRGKHNKVHTFITSVKENIPTTALSVLESTKPGPQVQIQVELL